MPTPVAVLAFALAITRAGGPTLQTPVAFHPPPAGSISWLRCLDDAMVGVPNLLRDAAAGKAPYAFVDQDRRGRAGAAVRKGIDCILATQVIVDGKRTAWCAQHDEKTLAPAPARSYELVSLSG